MKSVRKYVIKILEMQQITSKKSVELDNKIIRYSTRDNFYVCK